MKIGIGVTAYSKEARFNWPMPTGTPIKICTDQTTIARDKNTLIKQLYDDGCDVMFIFDDDCFPIKEGWERFFIDAYLKTGIPHFVLCDTKHNTVIEDRGEISLYSTGTGCMLFITRQVVETVGYFNNAYGKYGYEHCAYSLRVHKAGLTPAWYVSVNGWDEYIYSWDLNKSGSFNKVHTRTDEERLALIAANEAEWQKEQNSGRIYYAYD